MEWGEGFHPSPEALAATPPPYMFGTFNWAPLLKKERELKVREGEGEERGRRRSVTRRCVG